MKKTLVFDNLKAWKKFHINFLSGKAVTNNKKVVFMFRQIGPDHHVKDISGNYVDLTHLFDFVVDPAYYDEYEPKYRLKAQPGDRMRFVPRETSALQLEDDKLVIYDSDDNLGQAQHVSIPSACKGVATEVRPAAVVGRPIA